MILIIGGFASGKRAYVTSEYGFIESDMSDGVIDDRPVLYNLQNLATTPEAAQTLLPALLNKAVVICNEVGCGIVPLSHEDRTARDAAGRLCIVLAAQAARVVRMQCGIPTVIKG